jgi:hypothetical protein
MLLQFWHWMSTIMGRDTIVNFLSLFPLGHQANLLGGFFIHSDPQSGHLHHVELQGIVSGQLAEHE